ncbi:hypothetical protein ACFIJ5_03395 [Haloimpatiens sp. FM7330]|uniref:hypothetical protein n=1 Tax=Haloimpatiens sp. FM7330 TaxID=3298610 RepID=UPI003638AFEC
MKKNNVLVRKIVYIFLVIILSIALVKIIPSFNKNFNKTKVINLNKKLFNEEFLSDDKREELVIKEVKNFTVDDSILNLSWFTNEKILIESYKMSELKDKYDNGYWNIKTLDLNTGKKEVDGKIQEIIKNRYRFKTSPDNKNIIYGKYNKGKKEIYIYNISSKQHKKLEENCNFIAWMPDSSGFVGIKDNYMLLYQLSDNSKKNILDIYKDQIIKYLDLSDADFKVSKDGRKLYFSVGYTENLKWVTHIYSLSLDKNQYLNEIFKGEIYKYEFLNEQKIIFLGDVNDVEGLYIYDIKNKNIKCISKEIISDFEVDYSRSKIAFKTDGKNGMEKLKVFNIDKDGLENGVILDNDYNISSNFKWSKDGNKLLVEKFSRGVNKIYVFMFK